MKKTNNTQNEMLKASRIVLFLVGVCSLLTIVVGFVGFLTEVDSMILWLFFLMIFNWVILIYIGWAVFVYLWSKIEPLNTDWEK